MEYIAQIMGLLALICLILSMQQNNKKELLKIQILSNTFYGIQYALLNAFSGASMSLVSLLRCILFYNDAEKNKNSSILVLIGFITIILIFSVATYNGLHSLIPIIIAIIYTYGLWQNNMKIFRIISVIVASMWIYYNGVVGAYVSILGSIIEFISAIISIIRFDKNRYHLISASKKDIYILANFKLKTILESDTNNSIDEDEKNKIMNYITQNTKEHLNDYKLITIKDEIIGSLLIYKYTDGILLDEIYITNQYRNIGIGSKILSNLIESRANIYLWVYKNNEKAISLYKKFNFKIIEETDTRYKMLYKNE